MENYLNCNDEENPVICIQNDSINIQSKIDYLCQKDSHKIIPNKECGKEIVENYILQQCNRKKGKCYLFTKRTEISKYCENAFKVINIQYECGKC